MSLIGEESSREFDDEPDESRHSRRRRRRRRSNRDRVGFASLLPQLLTTANLAAGFYAIIKASGGDVVTASYAIFVAAVFDILDGRAARMTGNVSRFGAEYDSIADTVSFGVAPAMLAFHAGEISSLGWAGWVMTFSYTACASLRLARFNVSSGRYQGRFDGLPTPAGAGMIVSAVWFKNFLVGPEIGLGLPPILPAIGVMFLGLMMVSPVPYHSFKNLRFGQSYSATVIPVVISIVLIMEPELNFFLVGLAYVVSGPAGYLWRRRTGRSLLPVDEAAEATSDASTAAGAQPSKPQPVANPETDRHEGNVGSVSDLSARMKSGRAGSEIDE
ncbi:MAG TPA: CDP-diacylglycerol--serine O-phosphatidyltransferase [Myxococcales bacterium]|nr:CDP-diacylglycerol--serine O-phosphatidyltransferase [Myxococcales bacterium]HIK84868.1 CDP-diacylglycerol--serine O-phosphatidyltransferase [Myxococcales bacterium]